MYSSKKAGSSTERPKFLLYKQLVIPRPLNNLEYRSSGHPQLEKPPSLKHVLVSNPNRLGRSESTREYRPQKDSFEAWSLLRNVGTRARSVIVRPNVAQAICPTTSCLKLAKGRVDAVDDTHTYCREG